MPDSTNPRVSAYSAAHFAFEMDGKAELGMFRSIEGGGMKAEVMSYQHGGTYDRWRQLGKPKFEDIKLQVGMAMTEPFYAWIAEFFKGNPVRKDGTIVAADFYYKERARREFTDAMISELTFPKLDASDKNTAYMNVSMSVENIVFKKGGGGALQQNAGGDKQVDWKACNFSFSLDDFPDECKRVTKVDSFTIKHTVLDYHSGGRRTASKTPSAIDWPQLSFYLPEADAQKLIAQFEVRGVGGETGKRLNGVIDAFDNKLESHLKVKFLEANIANVSHDKADSATEEIKLVKFDLTVEKMEFEYKKGD